MRKYLLRPAFVLFLLPVLSGCDLINPKEDEPAYITIEKPAFSAGTLNFNSHEIVSGWVFENGQLLGLFDLPVTLPVLTTGDTRISVNAGVVTDGQRATRDMYPFYTFHDQKLTVLPGQSYTITPAITYEEGVKAPIEENFEISLSEFGVSAPYELKRQRVEPGDSLYYDRGNDFIGLVTSIPDTTETIRIVSSKDNVTIGKNTPVYLEFDLRSNLNVSVGVLYNIDGENYGPVYELTVFGASEWKKFYVNLQNEISQSTNPNAKFKIVFFANPGTSGRDYIAVDNVRLVHF
ncbi:MAG: hypothetical protein EOO03_11970 [Chitinophagaceae bacterium]|nr:MAG: hypothetical protein EOO03_11970 [Chitinophagaceae bacterium]